LVDAAWQLAVEGLYRSTVGNRYAFGALVVNLLRAAAPIVAD
jgi:hypothetical protein